MVAVALGLLLATHALDTLEPALVASDSAPPSRVLDFVRAPSRDPLLAEDLQQALATAQALEPALPAVDAAVIDPRCALPADLERAAARIVLLAEQLRVLATVDAAAGRPALAAAHVVRSADVARLLVRCDGATLDSLERARRTTSTARAVVETLIQYQWLDQKSALRAAQALAPISDAELLRAAGPLSSNQAIASLQAGLRKEQGAQRNLVELARARAPARVEQGDKVGVPDVEVRCAPAASGGRFIVSRAVLAVLRARGAQAILEDSQLFPALDGGGILILGAGPGARSCGLRDQDVLVAINGRGVASAQDVLAAQQLVAADESARFSLRRAGAIVDIELVPESR